MRKPVSKYIWIIGALALLVITALVSILMGRTEAQFPFGHIYQVEEVCKGGMAAEETPIFYLTADRHLLWESRDRSEFADLGSLREGEEENTWTVTPRDASHLRYSVWTQGETAFLSLWEGGDTTWEYRLGRVDTLTCALEGEEPTRMEWFAQEAYDSAVHALPALTVEGEGTLRFTAAHGGETLTVTERYYAGGSPRETAHTLESGEDGTFALAVETRQEKNNEFAVYHVAYAGGEYLVQVNFR